VGAIATTPFASAADPAPAPTPVPAYKPDFSAMNFLIGNWNCVAMVRGAKRTESQTTALGLDGTWLVTQTTSPQFDRRPDAKTWMSFGADSSGEYAYQTSPGWNGNTMIWAGKNPDGSSSTDIVTKVSDSEMSDLSTITDAQGKPDTITLDCKKSG
jgi:hypothetical protein